MTNTTYGYFLDTCYCIDLFDERRERHKQTKQELQKLIEEQETFPFYVNGLVHLEWLDMVDKETYLKRKKLLEQFELIEISREIFCLSIEFYRFAKNVGPQIGYIVPKPKWAIVDYIHFITAKCSNLTMLSHDKDMERLSELYNLYITQKV